MEQTTHYHLVKHVAVNISIAVCLDDILAFIFYICDVQYVDYKCIGLLFLMLFCE